MTVPLRWAAGDRARWRGIKCTLEYVADDGALVSYRLRSGEQLRFAIVKLDELRLTVQDQPS